MQPRSNNFKKDFESEYISVLDLDKLKGGYSPSYSAHAKLAPLLKLYRAKSYPCELSLSYSHRVS